MVTFRTAFSRTRHGASSAVDVSRTNINVLRPARAGAAVTLFAAILCLTTACGDGTNDTTRQPSDVAEGSAQPEVSMGGEALGGNAATSLLAQTILEAGLEGQVAWLAHEVVLPPGQSIEHSHEFAFVYARQGPHTLTEDGTPLTLEKTHGAPIRSGRPHRHGASSDTSVFWEVRLAKPGAGAPSGANGAKLLFESEPFGGVPRTSLAAFVHVLVPPDGQTSVHTHPGPEFIYLIDGEIVYENALIGAIRMVPGDHEGIPAGVAVQKRNPFSANAEFLSWFLVDPDQPFASGAQFVSKVDRGENLALAARGARVAGVSSNYASGVDDSAFGANNAIDGDPGTQWSSDGDGDDAWIELELAAETRVSAVGFWTRTMGTSAEIKTFRIVTDRGETVGPFEIRDASRVFYFDTAFTASRLRFEVSDSTGGNTGAVEIEVYGEPTAPK